MNEAVVRLEQIEQEIIIPEVADDALEHLAAKEKAGQWTVFCTGVTCPGSPA